MGGELTEAEWAVKIQQCIENKSGTIIHRFIRNNDISTDIKKIKPEDILDVKFTDVVYNDEKLGSCNAITSSADVKPVDDKDYLSKNIEDTFTELIKQGWKLFSSHKA
jgi:hypothetical protein